MTKPNLNPMLLEINFYLCRERATAEECLKHQWLLTQDKDSDEEVEKGNMASSTLKPANMENPNHISEEEEKEGRVTEELIVLAAYTLGQWRQSSDKESLTPEQKAITKRFKFDEPFTTLQEVPGEFIY